MCLNRGQKTTWQDIVRRFKYGKASEADAHLDGPSEPPRESDTGRRPATGLGSAGILQVPKKASPGTRTSIRPGQVATCALSARHLGAKGGAGAKKKL